MPSFGSRKTATPPSEPPASQPVEPSATERLNTLLTEQSAIHATLEEHRAKRAELLREDGSLGAVRALGTEDAELKLRLEQLAARVPDLERELVQERREEWERAWQTHRPGLAAAQAELTEAIGGFYAALRRTHEVHNAARGFGERLTNEFVRPPPVEPISGWALVQYLRTVEQRQALSAAAAQPAMVELAFEAPLHIPPPQRFVPRRVPVAEIEAISALAEPRRIRILYGPVRTANLNIGIARMHPDETHIVPARAAHTLVGSGCAEYVDETATAATAAA